MHTVYFENKSIVFATGLPEGGGDHIAVGSSDELDVAKLLQKIENSNTFFILCDSPEEALEKFSAQFKAVEAAGGVVENREGAVLMMLRRGRWDFPKGHVESGETCEQAALREVTEETGLQPLDIEGFITATRHIYHAPGGWEMKRTWWYAMRYGGDEAPTPQTEEGIVAIEWLGARELWERTSGTFATIRDVFRAYVETK